MKMAKIVLAKFLAGSLNKDPPKKTLTIFKHGLELPLPKTKFWAEIDWNLTAMIVKNPSTKTTRVQVHVSTANGLKSFSKDVKSLPGGEIQTRLLV
jgi:hypothetical protein